MPVLKLTNAAVERAKPKRNGEVEVYRDTQVTGLLCEVYPSCKTFVAWYRIWGRGDTAGRVKLGRYRPGFGVTEARRAARLVLAEAARGSDPAAEIRRKRKAGTFGQLVETYLKDQTDHLRPATHASYKGLLMQTRLKPLHKRQTLDISRGELIRHIERIKAAAIEAGEKGSAANHTLAVIKRVFSWAAARDLVPTDPARDIEPPVKKQPRQRLYTDDELQSVWNALDGSAMCDAIRICFYTGVRIETALGIRWSDVDLEAGLWTVTQERAGNKAGIPWLIPLVPEAVAILRGRANDTPWAFTTLSRAGEPTQATYNSSATGRIKEDSGVRDFRPQDVRRSINSFLASSRGGSVPLPVRDAILMHRPPGLESTYNIHDYEAEKREALGRWARHLHRLVDTGLAEVIPIGARA